MSGTPETDAVALAALGRPWHNSYVAMRKLAEKLELELAPFRDTKRGIGGYIDDLRNERDAALKEAAMMFAALKACDGKVICSLAREELDAALRDAGEES